MRILVAIKQVCDPDQMGRLHLLENGTVLDRSCLDRFANPFDEYALETALRLTENGEVPQQRLGDVVAITFGDTASEVVLRSALALGATRAIRVDATDTAIDAQMVAKSIAHLARLQSADLVIMGKQSVDGDGNEVAQRVAAILDWPQVISVAAIREQSNGLLDVEREVDDGTLILRIALPAVVSVDLRVILPAAVRSRHTSRGFEYPTGVRYASLPSILGAKRKQLDVIPLSELTDPSHRVLNHARYQLRRPRQGCQLVETVDELLDRVAQHAPDVLIERTRP